MRIIKASKEDNGKENSNGRDNQFFFKSLQILQQIYDDEI